MVWPCATERYDGALRWTPARHPINDEHPGQNNTSNGWRESRRTQGYEQLNYYRSNMPYPQSTYYGGTHGRRRAKPKIGQTTAGPDESGASR